MEGHGFRRLAGAAVAAGLVSLLAACGGGSGGGGGLVQQTPSPSGIGFTPNVQNDASLTQVNPPAIPAQAAAVVFADQNLAQHLLLTNAAGALGAGLQGQGVTIGVLDSGVDRSHPALAGRVTRNFTHLGSGNDLSVDDKIGHGTVVAALAAGKPVMASYMDGNGNPLGQGEWAGGVARQATIVSSRIIADKAPEDDGSGEGNEILAGEDYGDFFKALNAELADAGARIINNSWGGLYWNDPALTIELATAWKDFVVDRGGLIVFANGNAGEIANLRADPSDNAALPSLAADAALEKGWLTVGALDPDNPTQLSSYSQACGIAMNYCLVAPGTVSFPLELDNGVLALYRGSGTSFAAPQVSGAAASVWSAFPYFDNDLVRQTILGAATDLGELGVDPEFGWGLLDVSKAVNGPSHFAWGDVSVSFEGTSVWRNHIVGAGGLVKNGSGTLILAGGNDYSGDTRVQGGSMYLLSGASRSNVYVSQGATLWSGSGFAEASNSGNFFVAASGAVRTSNYTQSATGNLGVWLGSPLYVTQTATLAGQISVLGVKSGYTTTAKEILVEAASIVGTFDTLKAAPNVFLDATLGYDSSNVFLNINRINVANAVAGAGLSGITLASAQRVEAAMQAIDGGAAGIDAGFVGAAGSLQQLASLEDADLALRSLSGAIHAAADGASVAGIDAQRRALSWRFGELAAQGRLQGDWSHSPDAPGEGGMAAAGFQGDGWTMGSDLRLGGDRVAGFAFAETQVHGFSAGDRSRERQTQARFYTGHVDADGYAMLQLGAGRHERQLRRELLLGYQRTGVASEYAGDFLVAGLERGWRMGHVVPYAGLDYLQLRRDGFHEDGAEGFGLRSHAGKLERTQAIAGLRARPLLLGRLDLRGFAEWRHTLAGNGWGFDASFVGAESWLPLHGEAALGSGGQFGLAADLALGRRAMLSFGHDRGFGAHAGDARWSLKFSRRL